MLALTYCDFLLLCTCTYCSSPTPVFVVIGGHGLAVVGYICFNLFIQGQQRNNNSCIGAYDENLPDIILLKCVIQLAVIYIWIYIMYTLCIYVCIPCIASQHHTKPQLCVQMCTHDWASCHWNPATMIALTSKCGKLYLHARESWRGFPYTLVTHLE